MLDQVRETIQRYRLIAPGQRIAVACSGGPDSTALLLALEELSSELGCALSVTHFNHQLRGEESEQDEQFVRELADRLHLPIHGSAADVRACASQARANLEATARRLRYRYFFSLVDTGVADRVAVGHTADDQAETVLHRLLRGTGIRGLAGIHPTVGGRVIRPLLETRRQAVLDWLSSRQQLWREDASNRDLRFLRNRIRRQLLPLLAEMNPRVVEILTHTAEIARDEELFWEGYLEPLVAQHLRQEGGRVWVEIGPLRQMPPAVARRLLRFALRAVGRRCLTLDRNEAAGGPPGAQSEGPADFLQTRRLLDLAFAGRGGSSLSLPQGVVARKESSALLLELAEPVRAAFTGFLYSIQVPVVIPIPEIGSSFAFELIPLASGKARYNGNGKDLLDRRVSEGPLILRNWRPGDAYRQRGHRKQRKLKELFQRQRVSKSERVRWPVVVAGEQIVWSRGWGSAEGYAPGPGSEEALRIREMKS
jgi:tRNA(Ile)-lysidine synthase